MPGAYAERVTGLYLHVPFCSALCPYCDFAVVVGRADLHARYLDALVAEAEAEAEAAGWSEPIDTVFIGGGTPSLVDADLLARTLEKLRGIFAIDAGAEITIEANPESVDEASLRVLHEAGVNRVSVGAQSFRPGVLRTLGRTHTVTDIARAATAARAAHLANLSLDLIYGAPGETLEDWEGSLRAAIDLGVEHLSCYALTVEERTAFGKAVARGTMLEPDQDALAERYELAIELLGATGFEHYELSNWAKPRRKSRHNLVYWTQGNYLGLGLGAHSHRDGHRWWNTRSINRYLDGRIRDGDEKLDEQQRAEEWVHLRLRLVDGLDTAEAERRLGRSLADAVEELRVEGLAHTQQERLKLTVRGMLLENEVALRLLDRNLSGNVRAEPAGSGQEQPGRRSRQA